MIFRDISLVVLGCQKNAVQSDIELKVVTLIIKMMYINIKVKFMGKNYYFYFILLEIITILNFHFLKSFFSVLSLLT